ncbi:MAG: hypothetical protein CMP30_06775 [Roseibacillus sp.]|nr:hypothetical protein [Roseibacillus sp.]
MSSGVAHQPRLLKNPQGGAESLFRDDPINPGPFDISLDFQGSAPRFSPPRAESSGDTMAVGAPLPS